MTPYESVMDELQIIRVQNQLNADDIDRAKKLILENKEIITGTQTYIVILIGIAAAILLLGIWRAVKQRKIEKMLKQLLEEKDRPL